MKSIIEGREIAKDPNVKGYTNIEDLKIIKRLKNRQSVWDCLFLFYIK